MTKPIGVVPDRSGYSTIIQKQGMFLLSMAGHVITLYRGAEKPVDYKDGRRPHRVKQEFSPNHRYDPVFLLEIKRVMTTAVTWQYTFR